MNKFLHKIILGLSLAGSLLGMSRAQAHDHAPALARTSSTPWVTSRKHEITLGNRRIAFTETMGGKVSLRGDIDRGVSSSASRAAIGHLFAEVKRVVPDLSAMTIELGRDAHHEYRTSLKGNDPDAQASAVRATALYKAVQAHLGLGKVVQVNDADYDGVDVTITK